MGGDPLKTLGPHNSFPVVSRANTVVDYVDGGGSSVLRSINPHIGSLSAHSGCMCYRG